MMKIAHCAAWLVLARAAGLVAILSPSAAGDTWPVRQGDMQNTGRAAYSVPASRLNGGFFDAILWQKRSPGSPGSGGFGASSMVFFDSAGAGGADIVAAGYHWPKGVQGMDRHTGRLLWTGLPDGGESIGEYTPAFSPTGGVLYITNDATPHPLMAFSPQVGPSVYRHNGGTANPSRLGGMSPNIAPDGRIFLHQWNDRPYAGADTGSAIVDAWAAGVANQVCLADAALDMRAGQLRVVVGGRSAIVRAYDGAGGAELWNQGTGLPMDASPTIDPATGRVYIPAGFDSIGIVGLGPDGAPLWAQAAMPVFTWVSGVNNPQRASSAGCLSHDGLTFYFETVSQQGDGRLYAINTTDGSVKWSFATASQGWEEFCSSPIVTPNGVVIVGNNHAGVYYAVRDAGASAAVVDTLPVGTGGNARCSATLAADGTLYLPLRTYWTASNGDGEAPTGNLENLYTGVDLRAGASPTLPPPGNLGAFIGNHSVRLTWTPINDPSGIFDHYAIYRETQSFTSVQGRTPIGTASPRTVSTYMDSTAVNGTSYYYAVTSVATGGGQIATVQSIGPRTPRDETDLQVVTIARTPRYPRYLPNYTGYEITEPSGFGPYYISAATSLGGGQTAATQRWPTVGQAITYTATVRNRGTNLWSGSLSATWSIDGQAVGQAAPFVSLQPGQSVTFNLPRSWDDQLHEIEFRINITDARPENNALSRGSKGASFLTYIDEGFIENYRGWTASYPQADTDDIIDWLNRHMARFNQVFAAAGTAKRVHYEVLEVLPDGSPDPGVDTSYYAIFPFRYHANDGEPRLSGYYTASEDIDFGLLHEMGHQLGLIDLYQMDLPPELNQVSGRPYSAPDCLMRTCAPFLSPHSAGAMTHWLNVAHGYFGQYQYATPDQVRLRIRGLDGQPLPGATVTAYQRCNRPGIGAVLSNQVKFQGITDNAGLLALPNIPINPVIAPTTYAGDTLRANPFGYIDPVGTNGVLHFKVQKDGFTDYAWLDITEVNVAYWSGQTGVATFDRNVLLGGVVQTIPPPDLAEMNAASWRAWAQGASASVYDDTAIKVAGQGSVRFETDGGFDTLAGYPGDRLARWNLSNLQNIRLWVRAQNPNFSFQNSSPWIRLLSGDGYFEWRPNTELLNQALGQWIELVIPISGNGTWTRTANGTPTFSNISGIEIHADTWGAGFTLWLDGIRFDPAPCYANCDNSTTPPILNVIDFTCFLNKFAAADPYANCDASTVPPVLNVNDFVCFLNRFAAGCP